MRFRDRLRVRNKDFALPAEPGQDVTIPVTGRLTDLAGSQRNVAAADGMDTTFDIKATEAAMQIDAQMPADDAGVGGGTVDFQMSLTNLASQGTGKTPGQAFDLGSQMAQALAAGMTLDTTVTYDTLEGSFDVAGRDENGQDQTGTGSFATGASDIAFQMSGGGLGYKATTADAKAEMTISTLPFPISYALDQISGEMLIPVTKGDAAQPFKLAYALEGLTFADAIWNLLDPTSQLPRDPASLIVDLASQSRPRFGRSITALTRHFDHLDTQRSKILKPAPPDRSLSYTPVWSRS